MTISTEDLSPVQLLTSLINRASLLTVPSRQLFVLLHCLLPATFLPALDLLDRNLVVKPQLSSSSQTLSNAAAADNIKPDPEAEADHNHGCNHDSFTNTKQVYYVRSSPPITTHYSNLSISSSSAATLSSYRDKSSSQNYRHYNYEVRPYAWNCTCVAYTFSMVASLSPPASTTSNSTPSTSLHSGGQSSKKTISDFFHAATIKQEVVEDEREGDKKEMNGIEDEAVLRGEWRWGGPNVQKGQTPPVCKHLVACVLAERCPNLVGRLLVERKVTLEERVELSVLWE